MPRFAKGRSYMNDSDPVVHEALRWLRFSEEGLDVALRLITGPPSALVTPAGSLNKQQRRR